MFEGVNLICDATWRQKQRKESTEVPEFELSAFDCQKTRLNPDHHQVLVILKGNGKNISPGNTYSSSGVPRLHCCTQSHKSSMSRTRLCNGGTEPRSTRTFKSTICPPTKPTNKDYPQPEFNGQKTAVVVGTALLPLQMLHHCLRPATVYECDPIPPGGGETLCG
nr:hypothetical protein Iba_chr14fCG9540 [Ipomoea batatas]